MMSTGTSGYYCYQCDKFVRIRIQDTRGYCINCDTGFVEEMEPPPRRYEVFISFRGKDTRATFTSHLHAALQNAAITVFRDDDSIERGDRISTSLVRAIQDSQISIIVFSTNYAESRWCLDEFEHIMTCHKTLGQVVLPVFYGVDPSEVRHQRGDFGKAFQNLLNRIPESEHNQRWRQELREVTGFAGFVVLNSRNESEAIKDIVENITRLLDKTTLFIANNPVGVESRVQDMIQLLDLHDKDSDDVLLLGMWGMGGIGKTTIAKAIYNEIGRNFEGRCFLANIREAWEQNGRNFEGRCFLASRIIITTRDMDILRGYGVKKVYTMKEMDERESIELFSWHGFKQSSPRENFAEISSNVVEYSGGLPLALEVLGRYLFDRDVTEWKYVLEKLRRIPNDQVHKKLKISYDGLNDDTEKEMFLDIACFFIGMDRSDVMHILNGCELYADIGISVLIERSLVTVDDKNRLGMHDLLRDMGREIIRERLPKEPEKRSRLWFHTDVLNVLSEQTGTKAIEGLALKLPRDNAKCFSTKTFKKMKRLRLLQLAGVQLDGNFEYLSRNLKWLSWNGFPLTSIPMSFYQGNLVSIALENSNVRLVWKDTQRMEMLKILNLSHSHYLKQTPNFSNLPNLEKLLLTDCTRLSEVSNSIGDLNKVLHINLEGCISLRNLPRSIYKLKSLKTLILSGCLTIDKLEEDLEQMESLTTLIANNTAITTVPYSVVRSKSIGYISLCGYEGFSHDVFPSIILSWMSPINNLPSQFQTSTAMSSLVPFDVPHCSSDKLSSISTYLPTLQSLWVECSSEIQLSRDATIILDAINAKELESIATTSQVSKTSFNSILIQVGMNCQVANILKETILQNMTVNWSDDYSLPGNSFPNWLSFSCDGSSVVFEVPQVEGRNLKTMMCIVCSSTPGNTISDDLQNMLVKNYTRATIQIYKREALASLEDEEGQRVISSIEPGNKVEVVVVFGNGCVVAKTTIYLIYDKKMDQCHALDKNAIVCSDDETKCVTRISPQLDPMDDFIGIACCCGLMQCSIRRWIAEFICRLLGCGGNSS